MLGHGGSARDMPARLLAGSAEARRAALQLRLLLRLAVLGRLGRAALVLGGEPGLEALHATCLSAVASLCQQ